MGYGKILIEFSKFPYNKAETQSRVDVNSGLSKWIVCCESMKVCTVVIEPCDDPYNTKGYNSKGS